MQKLPLALARSKLSQMVDALSSGKTDGYIITRHGKSVARLIAEPKSEPPPEPVGAGVPNKPSPPADLVRNEEKRTLSWKERNERQARKDELLGRLKKKG